MTIENLTELEITNGLLTLAQVILYIVIGLQILTKYFSYRKEELLTVGASWIFLSSGWWGSAFSFLNYVLFGTALDLFLYLFLSNAFIPLALICWIYSVCKLAFPQMLKILVPFYAITGVIFESVLLYFLLTDPSSIGSLSGTFYYAPNLISMLYQIFGIFTALITGIIFARKSLQSADAKIKLKGKFLLIAFISFSFGAILDATIPMNAVSIIIVRAILMTASFEYYLGFHLPEKVANIFIRK